MHRTPHLPRTPSDVLLGLFASPQPEHFPAVVVGRPEHSGNIEFVPSSVPARPRGESRADVALKQPIVMSKECCKKLRCSSNLELRRHVVSDRTALRAANKTILERYDSFFAWCVFNKYTLSRFAAINVLSVHIASHCIL